jgi:Mrp family chromosome partitioning ATPase
VPRLAAARAGDDAITLALRLAQRVRGEPSLVVFTGLERGAGASTLAAEVAWAMARSYPDPLLLVDANFRDPILAARLGTRQSPGLSDLVRGGTGLDGVIQEIVPGSLFFLPAGVVTEDQGGLMATAACVEIFRSLRLHFRWVIADLPPVGRHVDGIVLGTIAQYVVLVLEKSRHRRSELAELHRMLSAVGISRAGVCLTEKAETPK